MGDLVILLYKIETFRNDRIILILVLLNLHENFDHILNPVANAALIQNGMEMVVYSPIGFWRVFDKESTNFTHETNIDFD